VDVNETFAIIMGIKREEIIGNTSTGVRYITAEQRAAVLSELNTKGFVENLESQTRIILKKTYTYRIVSTQQV